MISEITWNTAIVRPSWGLKLSLAPMSKVTSTWECKERYWYPSEGDARAALSKIFSWFCNQKKLFFRSVYVFDSDDNNNFLLSSVSCINFRTASRANFRALSTCPAHATNLIIKYYKFQFLFWTEVQFYLTLPVHPQAWEPILVKSPVFAVNLK